MAMRARNVHRCLHEAVPTITRFARITGETGTANEAIAQLDRRMERAHEIESETMRCAADLRQGKITEDDGAGFLECQSIMLDRLVEFAAVITALTWGSG